MNENKLFIEELKYIVENELSLNDYVIEQLQDRFNKSPFLIINLYQLLSNNKNILPLFNDIEATVYDFIVTEEMSQEKTYYGATMYVADMFDTTQTYIKFKINKCKNSLQKIG